MAINSQLMKAARSVVQDSLKVQPHEEVVIVVEEKLWPIADALTNAVVERNAHPTVLPIVSTLREILARQGQKMKLTSPMRLALAEADVIITAINAIVGEAKFRLSILSYLKKNPCRIAHMPGIKVKQFAEYCDTDYDYLYERGGIIEQFLKDHIGKEMEILTRNGTTLKLTISDLITFSSGRLDEPERFGNLPAGEVYFVPVVGSADGKIVIDGSVPSKVLRKKAQYIELSLRNGMLEGSIKDPENLVREALSLPGGNVLCEVGFGLNDRIKRPTGIELIDEKAAKTIHFGFGDNTLFGGENNSDIHIDLIVKNPNVKIDNVEFMKNGRFLL